MAQLIIPVESPLYQHFQDALEHRHIILLAGLPGVGKSLYLQQLALMAEQQGKHVYLLQWDVTRQAFETPEILAEYPEIDGVTHAGIRKAVGMWARQALANWAKHRQDNAILLGEVPLIGNRLIELAQQHDDEVEAVLASEATLFMLPVPSKRIRERIEKARAQSISQPQHARENADAPSHVLRALWHQVHALARQWQWTSSEDTAYDPVLYRQVYQRLLQHRRLQVLEIDEAFTPQGSVYDLHAIAGELAADGEDVARIMREIRHHYRADELEQVVAQWHQL